MPSTAELLGRTEAQWKRLDELLTVPDSLGYMDELEAIIELLDRAEVLYGWRGTRLVVRSLCSCRADGVYRSRDRSWERCPICGRTSFAELLHELDAVTPSSRGTPERVLEERVARVRRTA